jgi:murein DD-endopeptidase MepM/ murein hydrolase activator NlpD
MPSIEEISPKFYPELSFDYGFDFESLNPYRYSIENLKDTLSVVIADSHCGFQFPHPGKVNSTFGWRKGRVHSGIDLQLEWGDTVLAAFDGVVRVSKYHKAYGNFIIIRHFNGLETLYAHLKKRDVLHGDTVLAGDLIGLGGSTGRSTGAHLHFETRFLGHPIDPEVFIDFENRCLKSTVTQIHAGTFDVPLSQKSKRYY